MDGAQYEAYATEGACLDKLQHFPPVFPTNAAPTASLGHMRAPREYAPHTATPETIAELRSALKHISADEYSEWISVGQALSSLGEAGYKLWAEWSATSAKHNPDTDLPRWSTFAGDRTDYPSVFARAQRNGWVNPQRGASIDTVAAFGAGGCNAMPLPECVTQPGTPPALSDDQTIQWLASLRPLEYDRVRNEQANALGVKLKTLDIVVKAAQSDESEADRLPFSEVEPHQEAIDPAQLLNEVSDTIRRFIVLDAEQAHAAALWVAFTWFIDDVKVAPLAIITAPEPECGKSQLRDLLAKIVLRPLSTNNMKSATLFRIAEKWHPSLMLDEVDLMIRDDNEITSLINAGHHRGACEVWRLVGDNHEPKAFNVWGAKCFAGIALERLFPPSTLSRAIVIKLRRKLTHESVDRLRYAPDSLFAGIAAKLARFAVDYSQQVREARPILPDALGDRAQDNWEPLLAIASCAGDKWLTRATAAALKLSGVGEKTVSIGNELLADIQHVFESKRVDKISTADLIAALCSDGESAWAAYNKGKQLNARQLARLLKPYGIASKSTRLGAYETPKGFELSQFSDAFVRYLSPP